MLYYLCISSRHSDSGGGIDCGDGELGGGGYGLSWLPPIDFWECGVPSVWMDSLWPHGAFYGDLHSMYGLGFDWYPES